MQPSNRNPSAGEPNQIVRTAMRQRQNLAQIPGASTDDEIDFADTNAPDSKNAASMPNKSVKPTTAQKRKGSCLSGILLAVMVAVGGYAMYQGAVDRLSEQEISDRQIQYESMSLAGGLPLQLVTATDLDKAIDSLPASMDNKQKEAMREQVRIGQTKLAWLTLWDTHVEDGDILRFESPSSVPVEVLALNSQTTIAVPYPANGNITVTGVKDGGGGITIALKSGATEIFWPTMQPGDTLALPVTPAL